jgi:hypothetical protein
MKGLGTTTAINLILLIGWSAAPASGAVPQQPSLDNVLVIVADDLGTDVLQLYVESYCQLPKRLGGPE